MATSLYEFGCIVIITLTEIMKNNWIIPIPTLPTKLVNLVILSVTPLARVAPSGIMLSLLVTWDLSAKFGILSLYIISAISKNVFIERSHNLLAADGIWCISSWNSLVNCGIIITIERLEINNIDIKVIPKEVHLGILSKSLRLPVIVQSAIAIIIDAKNSISTSFKLHMINIEMTNATSENKVVGFKLNI